MVFDTYAEVYEDLSVMCTTNNTESMTKEKNGKVDTLQALTEALVIL